MPNTINLHRVIAATPEKLYRAFVEADAVASWNPPYGYLCTVHEMDVKVGGSFRMSFRNFTTGHSHSFGGTYAEVVPGERLVYTDKFDDPNLPGEMKVTTLFRSMIPPEACYLGWQQSLSKLATLVEPEICE